MALFPLGILSAAGAGGGAAGDFELISTEILGSAQSSITFSNLGDYSSTYKHLQIRFAGVMSSTGYGLIRFNGDTNNSNYRRHLLYLNASDNAQDAGFYYQWTGGFAGSGVVDILDAYNTSKTTVARTLYGNTNSSNAGIIALSSVLWNNTASLTSIQIVAAGNLNTGFRLSLYGVK